MLLGPGEVISPSGSGLKPELEKVSSLSYYSSFDIYCDDLSFPYNGVVWRLCAGNFCLRHRLLISAREYSAAKFHQCLLMLTQSRKAFLVMPLRLLYV
jgi:hypothetical protein